MANKSYEPGIYYDVRLTRPVQMGPFKYLPRERPRILGSTLNRIVGQEGEDVIGSAKPCE